MSQEGTQQPAGDHHHEEPDVQTTSFGLPQLEPVQERALDDDDRTTINALPVGSALLVAQAGPTKGARFLLDQDVTTVGRHPNADIFLDDVTVSRKHAEFRRSGDGFVLADAGSLNGTYVNHDRVDSVALRSGMEVQIGKFRLTFFAGRQQPRGS